MRLNTLHIVTFRLLRVSVKGESPLQSAVGRPPVPLVFQTLLDAPLHIINKSRLIRNEFCLCWAHECWYDNTQPQRIKPFIAQEYSPENARKIIRDLAQYFDNPRHIRIDGKPLLLVFAPERNPLMSVYSQIWREEAWAMGHTELCLAGVECHVGQHPANLGFDVPRT